jgi:hypothetical protein
MEFKLLNAVNAINLPVFYANWNAAGNCPKIYRINGYSTISDYW